MKYLIGTDEAGYGPNLGPLVITATAWQVPDDVEPESLYELLAESVCREPGDGSTRLAIADSKQLYSPGGDLRLLERGVAAAVRLCGRNLDCWRRIWNVMAELTDDQLNAMPWHCGYENPLPLRCSTDEIDDTVSQWSRDLERVGIRLLAVRSAVVFPGEFNEQVEALGNKAALLSERTLGLVARLLQLASTGPVTVTCDKHGGRNRYGALLQTLFPEHLVEVYKESRDMSVYRTGPPDRRCEFRFQVKGEHLLPTALASMVSKYLRELAMMAFNDYWRQQVPGIRPTAGYPTDARRFQQEIAKRQRDLGISDSLLWRSR